MVSRVVFGRGCFNQLDDILAEKGSNDDSFIVFLVDDVFKQSGLAKRISAKNKDFILWVNVDDEPKTAYVDDLTQRIKSYADRLPDGVVGIGGGSTMDLAKAVFSDAYKSRFFSRLPGLGLNKKSSALSCRHSHPFRYRSRGVSNHSSFRS
jgi:alcohol dehydrogenase class IV